MPLVFSYGSLQSAEVQRATFDRELEGTRDQLAGFTTRRLSVADPRGTITTLLPSPLPDARVDGTALEISDAELARADGYEAPDAYHRIAVTLASGRRAWTYLEIRPERSRIWFPGNPWPAGHALDSFAWRARRRDGRLWFHFALRTEAYDAEAPPSPSGEGDWESALVWTNYHRCTIASDRWHEGGFAVDADAASAASLDGRVFQVDDPPPADREDNAFYVYLLGHDACAHHRIAFHRIAGSDRFLIDWRGRIALAYAGDMVYRRGFAAVIHDVPMPAA